MNLRPGYQWLIVYFIVCLILVSNSQCSREKGSSFEESGKLAFDSGNLTSIDSAQIGDDSAKHSHWKLEDCGVLVQSADLGKFDESGLFPGSLITLDDNNYSDILVKFRLTLPSDSCAGLVFRADEWGNYYRLLVVMIEGKSLARLELIKDDKNYVLDSGQVRAKPDRPVEVSLVAKKDILQVQVGGEEELKARNEALTAGSWGLFAGGAGGVRFERILVYEE
jgi:hypothetical protein